MEIRQVMTRQFAICLFIIVSSCILLSACGSGDGSSNDPPTTIGAILFNLDWDGDSIERQASQSLRGDPCLDHGIDSISVDVKDSTNTIVASQSWACTEHPNTIAEVPVGSDLILAVAGIINGNADWQGQATGISVVGGQEKDIGTVVMNHIADDVIPPTVTAHYPTSGSTDIPIAATITITFSERIASESVNSLSCMVSEDGSTDSVDCTISYDDASRRASLSPISQFKADTSYTVTITTEIRDLAGLHMTSDESWTFTTDSSNTDRSLIWDNRNWDGSLWN